MCVLHLPAGALDLPSSVLHTPSFNIRSNTGVYTICHQVYCRGHAVLQEPHLSVLHLPSSVLHTPLSNIRSNTGVYCTSHQVYCGRHVVLQEPHLGVLHLPSSVLHMPSCISGASLGCTAFAIVYCICHYLTSGATLGCTILAIKCTAETMLYFMPSSVL